MISDEIQFPHYTILKASAGSGKTHALTERYVYFLLSKKIPSNNLRNILAITFSNNASYEMKSRILELLKCLYLKDESLRSFCDNLCLSQDEASELAGKVIDEILSNYSDFQVRTIDSFMTNVFKASALDFEFNPDFEIHMNNESLMKYAYDLFLKDAGVQPDVTQLFEEMTEKIQDSVNSFVWDPATEIYRKIKRIYEVLTKTDREIAVFDEELFEKKRRIELELCKLMQKISEEVKRSGLERNNQNKVFNEFPRIIKEKRLIELIDRGIKTCPVKRNKKFQDRYEMIESLWKNFQSLVSLYTELYCQSYFMPYIKIFENFYQRLKEIKKREGKIFIEDINKLLSGYLNEEYVPEVYFRIGEKVYHFFIDEFQDTSTLQWLNLKPLIENSLSEKGSLFIVGDTKQAIYTFRGADYKIMKQLEDKDVFPSAKKIVEKLNVNYRSRISIIKFTEDFFKKTMALDDKYKQAANLTGLNDCEQIPHEEFTENGYVEIKFLSDEDKLKDFLRDVIDDLMHRGYRLKDITVLASKNEQVEMLSFLLSELGIPFLSYSSVDVKKRKVTSEIIYLLKFLDSPLDDFSFSVFIMGDIYRKLLEKSEILVDINDFLLRNRDVSPLYKVFEKEFPDLWKKHFENLFKLTGYLPVYDLVSTAISNFQIFEIIPEEEATFLKILELVRFFEGRGLSSIKDFVDFFSEPAEDETIWNISLPADTDAVKLMTIHKAKGLQSPVTVVFLENKRNPSDGMVLYESDRIQILKINEKVAEKSEELRKIKNNEALSDIVELLNKLYVAFTRAEKELYVVCRINEKDEKNYPFNVLSGYLNKSIGEKTKKEISEKQEKAKQLLHYKGKIDSSSFDLVHLKEKSRGELIHKILSKIEFIDEDLEDRVSSIIEELSKDIDYEEIKESVLKTVKNTHLAEYFVEKQERKVFNEFEICDAKGLLHRIDRLVIDRNTVTVIDYKTGRPSELYPVQLKLYMDLVSNIFLDKKVKGILYYIDSEETVWI